MVMRVVIIVMKNITQVASKHNLFTLKIRHVSFLFAKDVTIEYFRRQIFLFVEGVEAF